MHIEDLATGDLIDICVLGHDPTTDLFCSGRFLERINSGRGKRLRIRVKVSMVGDQVLPMPQIHEWFVGEVLVRKQEIEI